MISLSHSSSFCAVVFVLRKLDGTNLGFFDIDIDILFFFFSDLCEPLGSE